jgi:selT/selW/selH-like putative selenoprotein
VRLKSEIEAKFKTPVAVKMGRPGALNIYVDGQQVYSYQRTGRFPNSQDLAAMLGGG